LDSYRLLPRGLTADERHPRGRYAEGIANEAPELRVGLAIDRWRRKANPETRFRAFAVHAGRFAAFRSRKCVETEDQRVAVFAQPGRGHRALTDPGRTTAPRLRPTVPARSARAGSGRSGSAVRGRACPRSAGSGGESARGSGTSSRSGIR